MTPPVLAIVGTGAVAHAIGRAYSAAGGRVGAVVSRSTERAQELATACGAGAATTDLSAISEADLALVAVSDAALETVGSALVQARHGSDALPPVLHTSGALPGSVLGGEPLRAGSLHPLQTFAGAAASDARAHVAGTHWFHEGAGDAQARQLVEALDGHFHSLRPGAKVLYHAGAAVLSNHLVALYASAADLLSAAGLAPEEIDAPLLHLLRGTVANLTEAGLPSALTGPVARGDVATVASHLEAIRATAPRLEASYRALALVAVPVALAKGGLDAAAAARLRELLG